MAKKRIKTIRKFSTEFELLRVKEYENGKFTVLQLARIFDIYPQVFYNWICKYSTYNKKKTIVVSNYEKMNELKKQYAKFGDNMGNWHCPILIKHDI